ncbi:hypothetical protein [Nodosilinea nodulosa]|uniref:hypothetical protein n=1 Tax=Nodosilinea nodulosa TaxID=416001 RepID=UPI0003705007|nr:hypothetical protein [Nodosilinea nodulosa]
MFSPKSYKVAVLDRSQSVLFEAIRDSYDLSSIKRPRVKRFLTWLLKKAGATDYKERRVNVNYTEVQVGPDSELIEMAYETAIAVYEQSGKLPKFLLVGRDEQYKLYREAFNDPMTFDISAPLAINGRRHIHGMTIIMIPWMNGLLPMLSLEDLKEDLNYSFLPASPSISSDPEMLLYTPDDEGYYDYFDESGKEL